MYSWKIFWAKTVVYAFFNPTKDVYSLYFFLALVSVVNGTLTSVSTVNKLLRSCNIIKILYFIFLCLCNNTNNNNNDGSEWPKER
jgi:hypothetical protein